MSASLKLTNNFGIAAITQGLIRPILDALIQEVNGPIAEHELSATRVPRLEALRSLPIPVSIATIRTAKAWGFVRARGEVDRCRRRRP